MIAHWQNFLGVLILAIILHCKCNLAQRVQKRPQLPLCSDGRLYFDQTKKCYYGKKRGPCGEQMALEETAEGSGIGVCKCDIPDRNLNTCPIRPKVFIRKYSRCFSLYDQGPCKTGEWLVPTGNKNGNTKCEVIPCPEKYKERYDNESYKNQARDDSKFVFAHEGKCYLTQSMDQGNLCKKGENVYFVGIEKIFYRKCSSSGVCGFSSTPETGCPGGAKPDAHGGCESNTQF